MLDQFLVTDLQFQKVVVLKETETLQSAAEQIDEVGCELLVVTQPEGGFRGVVLAETVTELATLAPEGPLSGLMLQAVLEVPSNLSLLDAVRLASRSGIGALAVRRSTGEYRLLGAQALIDFNAWGMLVRARERRLASSLPALN